MGFPLVYKSCKIECGGITSCPICGVVRVLLLCLFPVFVRCVSCLSRNRVLGLRLNCVSQTTKMLLCIAVELLSLTANSSFAVEFYEQQEFCWCVLKRFCEQREFCCWVLRTTRVSLLSLQRLLKRKFCRGVILKFWGGLGGVFAPQGLCET